MLMIAAFLLLLVPGQVLAAPGLVITLPDGGKTTNDTPVPVDESNRYGYLTIKSIDIVLSGTDTEITVKYEITPWIAFLVFLFGKQDLKNRVLSVVGYPEVGKENQVAKYTYVDNDRAEITVENVIIDYRDGSYWYPAHTFGTVIPKLTFVIGPTESKTYDNIQIMPKGFGYFK
ncbi:MAG TPA: hypothetical protein O0X01_04580 [Methanocorpusculum sp.]|nr:hypothetical protein [Methanocorpusculum sp.]